MRTTLTLDDNLLLTLKRKAAENNVPFKTIVNQTLQLGLEVMEKPLTPKEKYHTPTRSLKLKTGYDLDKLGKIADEMEDEEGVKQKQ
jgi:hypothetical protein